MTNHRKEPMFTISTAVDMINDVMADLPRPPTPIRDAVRDAVVGRTFDVGRGAVFTTAAESHVSMSVSRHNDKFLSAEFTVYGEFTYRDRTDSSATVTIRIFPGGSVTNFCRSTAWNGRSYVEMPEGARNRVAAAVGGAAASKALGDAPMKALEAIDAEEAMLSRYHKAVSAMRNALRELDTAARSVAALEAEAAR